MLLDTLWHPWLCRTRVYPSRLPCELNEGPSSQTTLMCSREMNNSTLRRKSAAATSGPVTMRRG
eukprot:5629975-Alexandrium_andersonii.AAC.1